MARTTALVFIDAAVYDDLLLVNGTLVHDALEAEMIALDAEQDGVEQITEVLTHRRDVHSLHLVSRSAGSLQLGSGYLTIFNLERYGWRLQAWGEAFVPSAKIYLYGCVIGEQDQAFAQRLSLLTGAVIVFMGWSMRTNLDQNLADRCNMNECENDKVINLSHSIL